MLLPGTAQAVGSLFPRIWTWLPQYPSLKSRLECPRVEGNVFIWSCCVPQISGAEIPFPKDTPRSGCRNSGGFDFAFYRKPWRFGMGGIWASVPSSSIKFQGYKQENPHAGASWGARHREIMGIMSGFWVCWLK